MVGLAVTLAAVAVFSLYTLHQIAGLKDLQTSTVDRNRKDSLQLLRIQNDLHTLGLAMRDMLDSDEPYPLEAWKGQFHRIRLDLADAIKTEAQLSPAGRDPGRQQYVASAVAQFFTSVDQLFALALESEAKAKKLIRTSLQAQQAALTNTVARLLVENNETEQQAMLQIQAIYERVERQIYIFLAAMLLAISLTTLYLIRSNRLLFNRLALLSDHRSELARKLITVQEEVLHSMSRELHDEFGQILTAIGAMLRRAEKKGLPPDSPFRAGTAGGAGGRPGHAGKDTQPLAGASSHDPRRRRAGESDGLVSGHFREADRYRGEIREGRGVPADRRIASPSTFTGCFRRH